MGSSQVYVTKGELCVCVCCICTMLVSSKELRRSFRSRTRDNNRRHHLPHSPLLTGCTVMCVTGMHHHKQLYHHRGREGQEEVSSRPQTNFIWNADPANQYAGRSRNYADGAGASTLDGMGYRYVNICLHTSSYYSKLCCQSSGCSEPACVCVTCLFSAAVKAAHYREGAVRRHQKRQAKVMRAGVAWKARCHWRIWRETRRSCSGWWKGTGRGRALTGE